VELARVFGVPGDDEPAVDGFQSPDNVVRVEPSGEGAVAVASRSSRSDGVETGGCRWMDRGEFQQTPRRE
jgi:hypothetical protein